MTYAKWILCLSFSASGLVGCGADEKPKKPAGIEGELKPLPSPGSPGGGGVDKSKNGKAGGTPTAG